MQHAIDRLGLCAGMRVLDMGGGWGCFVEYAGRQGIRVEAITISREQHRFVTDLITRERLPCSITLVDFIPLSSPRRRPTTRWSSWARSSTSPTISGSNVSPTQHLIEDEARRNWSQ